MKYKSLFLLITVSFAYATSAKVVDQTEAMRVASDFFNNSDEAQTLNVTSVLKEIWNSNQLSQDGISTRGTDTPTFYVFAPESGKGFVIVSAEDATTPILGYSFEDDAPEGELPCNLQYWFEAMHSQISQIRSDGITAPSSVKQRQTRASAWHEVFVVQTAKWNQNAPYNEQCPIDGSSRCITGCVATSTAIVMRYHQWPESGSGKTDSYRTSTRNIYVESRSLEHAYDWSNMPLDDISEQYTDEEAYAVSTLMADIGYLLQSDYTSSNTSATTSPNQNTKLSEHFDYSSDMSWMSKSYYDDDTWYDYLKNDMKENGPVLYIGQSKSASHQFVVDGFTDDDYFHINWGWGGSSNGFFLLPDIDYSGDQKALLGFVPNAVDITNGIADTVAGQDTGSDVTYDIAGRIVTNPAKGGIYIRGGKKILF